MKITLEKVKKVYSTDSIIFTALHDIDLQFEPGEFCVVAGPSGSGKTTLLNLIGTLDSPTEGEILYDDKNVGALTENEKTDVRLNSIGFIFQAYNLINVLTAEENVAYTLHLQGLAKAERREKARALLDLVGLNGLEDRRPEELSGGQQQRVAVARALASGPDLVLADEPTANVDQETGKGLMDLMHDLNRERGITFIMSSHDEMVIKRARRQIRLRDGKVILDVEGD
jgi:putative ABC transport system ATP-binding protein